MRDMRNVYLQGKDHWGGLGIDNTKMNLKEIEC